ncbi:PadR family transcriptional regulator [Alicyclobacillus cycloheptanicus]|uniref:DNA-binding PadR family transcriptional regulator n=1 Tax=Alicyclobacillus cycloheptanicus TaxID=1457 RepID=A0ABT9XKQ1_9BACL|nr:helix-turn-helix transcriptional regulator [Alicyclobacillus cycloheptanicus]MDQ0190889.1 DNA-binding PadR family transcriptional regulator [Alicyclobacillus cycloheptanicus]
MPSTQDVPLTEAHYYILLSVYGGPLHGYGMMQQIEQVTLGRLKIGAGTLYTALNALLKKGWLTPEATPSETDSRRKLYAITAAGKQVVEAELKRLEELLENGRKLTGDRRPSP